MDGRTQRVRPPPDRGLATYGPRQRASPPDGELSGTVTGRHAPASVPHPQHRAAEAPRDRPPDRPLVLDPRRRAVPREHLLAARKPRGRIPHDPRRAQDTRGARSPELALPAREQ